MRFDFFISAFSFYTFLFFSFINENVYAEQQVVDLNQAPNCLMCDWKIPNSVEATNFAQNKSIAKM